MEVTSSVPTDSPELGAVRRALALHPPVAGRRAQHGYAIMADVEGSPVCRLVRGRSSGTGAARAARPDRVPRAGRATPAVPADRPRGDHAKAQLDGLAGFARTGLERIGRHRDDPSHRPVPASLANRYETSSSRCCSRPPDVLDRLDIVRGPSTPTPSARRTLRRRRSAAAGWPGAPWPVRAGWLTLLSGPATLILAMVVAINGPMIVEESGHSPRRCRRAPLVLRRCRAARGRHGRARPRPTGVGLRVELQPS